jgi:anionic cell wall polymer biosynthesis LytR-Cps2A-Psr (LCP) family protein
MGRRFALSLAVVGLVAASCAAPPVSQRTVSFAGATLPTPGVDGVGLVDISQGRWYLRDPAGAITAFYYGNPGDLPIAGDWDGDDVATPGLYRQSDGFFYARNSNTEGVADNSCFAGDPADVPIVGDWDGDGDDNLGIYRPSEQRFYLFTITCTGSPMGAAQISLGFGNPGDQPVAGDWDGDGVDEIGLYRESTGFFYWRNTLDTGIATGEIFFGDPGDRFVAGDWGVVDGIDTPAIFRPAALAFFLRFTLTQGVADDQFPIPGAGQGWLPVAGQWQPGGDRVVNLTLPGAPETLRAAVEDLYLRLSDAPGIPAGLASHLASIPVTPGVLDLDGATTLGTVLGTQVAVVRIGADVVLAAADPAWRVVGAKLASAGKVAWYGPEPRSVLVLGAEHSLGLGSQGPAEEGRADSVHLLTARASDGRGSITGMWRFTLLQTSYGVDTVSHSMQAQPEWSGAYPDDVGGSVVGPPWVGKPFGPAVTLDAMRATTGLPIEGYVVTGFDGFTALVDTVNAIFGAFRATLPWPDYPNPYSENGCAVTGTIGDEDPETLTGADALTWARQRVCLGGGDTDRQLAHGVLVEAALALVRSGDVAAVPAWLDLLDGFVVTDLSAAHLLTLGATAFELHTGKQVTDGSGPGDPFDAALPNVVVTSCVGAIPNTALSPYTRVIGPYRTLWSSGRTLWPVYQSFFADLADGFIDNFVWNITPVVPVSEPVTPGVTCHEGQLIPVTP